MSWLTPLLSILSGLWNFAAKVVDFIREKSLIAMGRTIEQGEMAKHEAEVVRTASEVMAKEVTREETIEKMKKGDF